MRKKIFTLTTIFLLVFGAFFIWLANNRTTEANQNTVYEEPKNIKVARNVDTAVSNWENLQKACNNASTNTVIQLANDINANGKNRIYISGKTLFIDLNGHKLNRGRSDTDSDGHVIELQNWSNVTIYDSTATSDNTAGNGVITGGYAKRGGGIHIGENCVLNFESGTISGNKASIDGGGIYNRGFLNMTGGLITNNWADSSGGALFSCATSSYKISNTSITDNKCDEHGGAFYSDHNGDSYVTNSIFRNNSSGSYGGCIYNTAQNSVSVTYDNVQFIENKGTYRGGAIYNETGDVIINNCKFEGNTASGEGGAVYALNPTNIYDSTFSSNYCSNQGGGIFSNAITTVRDCKFNNNTSVRSGGGISVNGSSATIENCEFTFNRSEQSYGGAVHVESGAAASISGGTFNNNSTAKTGGAIYVDANATKISLEGKIVFGRNSLANTADCGKGIYLRGNKKISISGAIEKGSYIIVASDTREYTFTDQFNYYNPDVKVSNYFHCDITDVGVYTGSDGEGTFKAGPGENEMILNPFIPDVDQLTTNPNNLTGVNWLTGISNEKRINQINIPGTHDSSMADARVDGKKPGDLWTYVDYAVTQKLFIPEQLEAGSRIFDLRVTCFHQEKSGNSWKTVDDGKTLWMDHGKSGLMGSYWAVDENGNFLNLDTVLGYMKDFLIAHPSEFLILDFQPETHDDDDKKKTQLRLNDVIKELAKEINPSTGKPFIYYEDGVYGSHYTYFPKLGDVRGQILLMENNGNSTTGGFASNYKDSFKVYSPEGNYKDATWEKIYNVIDFYKNYNSKLNTTVDDNFDFLYTCGTNCTNNIAYGATLVSPLSAANVVLKYLFEGGTRMVPGEISGLVTYEIIDKVFGEKGKYYGWVRTDGATEEHFKAIYESNFFEGVVSHELTIKSGLTSLTFDDYTYAVGDQQTIVLPATFFNVDPDTTNNYLEGWVIDDDLYKPGDSYVVTADKIITAKWNSDAISTFNVNWKDSKDYDGIRPSELTIEMFDNNDSSLGTFTVSELLGWHTTIVSFNVKYMKPVSDLIVSSDETPYGVDTINQYRYAITGTLKEGYVLTLYHTPENMFEVSGTVEWVDDDDANGARPDSVSVNLYANGELKETIEATSADNWVWTFSGYPEYVDGQLVDYEVKQTPVDDYYVSSYETILINYYLDYVSYIRGFLEWTDNNDETNIRPDKVSISLVADGNVVDTIEIEEKVDESDSENRYTAWQYTFFTENLDLTNVEKLSLTLNNVSGYIYKVSDDITGVSLYIEDYEDIMNVVSRIDAIGEVTYTKESYALIMDARDAYDGLETEIKQKQVSNYNVLTNAEHQYLVFVSEAEEIDNVIDTIDAIGKISYSKSCIGLIEDARLAYDTLDDNLKGNVTNYETLCVAEKTYAALGSLVSEVGNVYMLIEQINVSDKSYENYEKIFLARAAYDNLTPDLQSMVNNYDKLVAAENAFSHTHSFTYTANGNTITASCENCTITEGLTLTLNGPTDNLVYDGNAKTATIEEGYNTEAFVNPQIKYYKDGKEVESCVEVGKYVAKVTYEGATAEASFEILSAASNVTSSNNNTAIIVTISIIAGVLAFTALGLGILLIRRRKG